MNIAFDLKYEILSDDDEKEEVKPISWDAPLTGMYNSMQAKQQQVGQLAS